MLLPQICCCKRDRSPRSADRLPAHGSSALVAHDPAMARMPFVCRTSKADGGDRRSVHGRRRVVRRPRIDHPNGTIHGFPARDSARNPWIIRLKKNLQRQRDLQDGSSCNRGGHGCPLCPFYISLSLSRSPPCPLKRLLIHLSAGAIQFLVPLSSPLMRTVH